MEIFGEWGYIGTSSLLPVQADKKISTTKDAIARRIDFNVTLILLENYWLRYQDSNLDRQNQNL